MGDGDDNNNDEIITSNFLKSSRFVEMKICISSSI